MSLKELKEIKDFIQTMSIPVKSKNEITLFIDTKLKKRKTHNVSIRVGSIEMLFIKFLSLKFNISESDILRYSLRIGHAFIWVTGVKTDLLFSVNRIVKSKLFLDNKVKRLRIDNDLDTTLNDTYSVLNINSRIVNIMGLVYLIYMIFSTADPDDLIEIIGSRDFKIIDDVLCQINDFSGENMGGYKMFHLATASLIFDGMKTDISFKDFKKYIELSLQKLSSDSEILKGKN